MRISHHLWAGFDDPNLIDAAEVGLMGLAGLHRLVGEHVSVRGSPGAHAVAKVSALVARMVAAADSFENPDVLRHGAMARLFTGPRAPTTVGTHMRAYRFGHGRQPDAVASGVLAGVARLLPGLLAGGDQVAYLDPQNWPAAALRP